MSGFALIPAFFNAVGGGISTTDEAAKRQQLEAFRNRMGGMRYAQPLPQQDRSTVATPGKTAGDISSAMLGGFDPMKQMFGGALKGEQALYSPSQMPTAGGYALYLDTPYSGDDYTSYRTRRP